MMVRPPTSWLDEIADGQEWVDSFLYSGWYSMWSDLECRWFNTGWKIISITQGECLAGHSVCDDYLRITQTDVQWSQEPQPKCYIVSPSTNDINKTVDVIFILFPICRNFISLLRRTPLNSIIPFDRNVDFHSKPAPFRFSSRTWTPELKGILTM